MNAQELIERQRNQVVYAAKELIKVREVVKAFPEGYSRFAFMGNGTIFLKDIRGFKELLVLLAEIDHLGPELSNYYLENNDAIRLNFILGKDLEINICCHGDIEKVLECFTNGDCKLVIMKPEPSPVATLQCMR